MDSSNNESFFGKMRTDKKYRAKVELIGYGLMILVIVLGLNIGTNGNKIRGNIIYGTKDKTDKEDNVNLLKSITNNYEYDMEVSYDKIVDNESKKYVEHYTGKSYLDKLVINRNIDNEVASFYKMGNKYYTKDKEKEDNFVEVDSKNVYGLLVNNYLELDNIKEYLNQANLDHVTNYSNGKIEEIYHLNVGSIILGYKGEEVIDISVLMENESLVIKIDYSNLYKVLDLSVEKCDVLIKYSNIGKVEDFSL